MEERGSIKVICGPMFAGKTEELIRLVVRSRIAQKKIQAFKPLVDNRYHDHHIVSHSGLSVEAEVLGQSNELLSLLNEDTEMVAIDEAQFFDDSLVGIVESLAFKGVEVVCAGIEQNYRGEPFGPMPFLLALADNIQKIKAVCNVCGQDAGKSYRLGGDPQDILIGGREHYQARCRRHWRGDPLHGH